LNRPDTAGERGATRPPLLSGRRHGFYVTESEKPPATDWVWPWALVVVSILAALASMAR
jgi:hypothetical protein